jgi:hypothetical protein
VNTWINWSSLTPPLPGLSPLVPRNPGRDGRLDKL